ncbi:MAG: hypothetical protein Q7R53_02670 [bacterium]|nr:hypothetical protein [bacterium]
MINEVSGRYQPPSVNHQTDRISVCDPLSVSRRKDQGYNHRSFSTAFKALLLFTIASAALYAAYERYVEHEGPKAAWTQNLRDKLEGTIPLGPGEVRMTEALKIVPAENRLPGPVSVDDYPNDRGGVLAPVYHVGKAPLGAKIGPGAILTGTGDNEFIISQCVNISTIFDPETGKEVKLNPIAICAVDSKNVGKANK